MKGELLRYDTTTDGLVPVTQEWVDAAQTALTRLASIRHEVRRLVNAPFVDDKGVVRE